MLTPRDWVSVLDFLWCLTHPHKGNYLHLADEGWRHHGGTSTGAFSLQVPYFGGAES